MPAVSGTTNGARLRKTGEGPMPTATTLTIRPFEKCVCGEYWSGVIEDGAYVWRAGSSTYRLRTLRTAVDERGAFAEIEPYTEQLEGGRMLRVEAETEELWPPDLPSQSAVGSRSFARLTRSLTPGLCSDCLELNRIRLTSSDRRQHRRTSRFAFSRPVSSKNGLGVPGACPKHPTTKQE